MRAAFTIPALTALALTLAGCDTTNPFASLTRKSDDTAVATQTTKDRAIADPQAPAASLPVAAESAPLSGVDYVASQVQTGKFPCSASMHVTVTPDPQNPKQFIVEGQGFSYRMIPMETASGAIRLEEQTQGVVWLQVASKSMLMNQKTGKRAADGCVSPQQTAYSAQKGIAVAQTEPAAAVAPAASAKKPVAAKKTAAAKKPAAKTTSTTKKK